MTTPVDTNVVIALRNKNATLDSAAAKRFGTSFQLRDTSGTRPILADFVIGARGSTNGFRFRTLDERFYRRAFPSLAIDTF